MLHLEPYTFDDLEMSYALCNFQKFLLFCVVCFLFVLMTFWTNDLCISEFLIFQKLISKICVKFCDVSLRFPWENCIFVLFLFSLFLLHLWPQQKKTDGGSRNSGTHFECTFKCQQAHARPKKCLRFRFDELIVLYVLFKFNRRSAVSNTASADSNGGRFYCCSNYFFFINPCCFCCLLFVVRSSHCSTDGMRRTSSTL